MPFVALLGRILYSAIFILSSFQHFTKGMITYAANQGVPLASFLVPASGVLALLGGLSILLGYKAKLGAWLIALFLIPITFAMHEFWKETDPMVKMTEQIMFMKNISMLGAAFLITYFGAGPYSLDNRN
jgi:putative oxidoreductase